MDTNILKVNGEYVKFYVTTNSTMPRVLRNTGALTVVHHEADSYNDEQYNEMYLGNNFLASGYGVSSVQAKNMYNRYGAAYLDDLTYLEYRLKELDAAYAYATQYTTDMLNYITKNYIGNAGDTTNAHIVLDGEMLSLGYIRDLFEPADYDDLEVVEFKAYLTYSYCDVLGNDIENSVTYCYALDNLTFSLPYGAKVGTFNMTFKTYNNTTDGFSSISGDYYTNNGTLNSYMMFGDAINQISTTESEYAVTIDFDDMGSEYAYLIKDTDNYIIRNLSFTNNGSTTYIPYPKIAAKGGNITSYENIIKPYVLQMDVDVKGVDYMYVLESQITAVSELNNMSMLDYFGGIGGGDTAVTPYAVYDGLENIDVEVSNGNVKCLIVAIPQKYDLTYGWYINDYVHINCTGEIFSFGFSHDKCVKKVWEDTAILYKFYGIYFNNAKTPAEGFTLHLKVRSNGGEHLYTSGVLSSIYYGNDPNDGTKIINNKIIVTDDFVQNEFYNGLHWLRPVDLSYLTF